VDCAHSSKTIDDAMQRSFRTLLSCVSHSFEETRHSLKVKIKVSAPGSIPSCQLIEQIPYLIKKDLVFSSMDGKIRSLRASLPSGAGILLKFDRRVSVRQGPVSTATFNPPDRQIGLLEIVFEENYDGTGESQLNYEIKADDKPM